MDEKICSQILQDTFSPASVAEFALEAFWQTGLSLMSGYQVALNNACYGKVGNGDQKERKGENILQHSVKGGEESLGLRAKILTLKCMDAEMMVM